MQRLEPWLLFLSVLGILFIPSPKGLWWLVLMGLAISNAIRRWRDAWAWFSLQSMGEMLRSFLWVPGIILLYFAMHSYAPQFVHASPATDHLVGRHRMVVDVHLPDGSVHRSAWLYLRIQQKRGRIDIFGQVLPDDDSARAIFNFEGVASFGDYIRNSLDGYRNPIPFRILRASIPWKGTVTGRRGKGLQRLIHQGRGTIGFNRVGEMLGKPLNLELQTNQGLSLRN